MQLGFVDSTIGPSATASTCAQAPCEVRGLQVTGSARIRRARIAPPLVAGAAAHGVVFTNGSGELSSSAVFAPDRALDVSGFSTVVVRGSTLVGAEVLSNAAGDVTIDSSILGSSRKDRAAVALLACPQASKTSIGSSVFVGAPSPFAYFHAAEGGACNSVGGSTNLAGTVAAANPKNTFTVTNVRRVTASCAGEDAALCVARSECDGDAKSCLSTVLVADASTTEPRLKDGVACAIAQGGAAFAEVSDDVFATPRTAPFAMGAHEWDGTCTP